MAKPDPTTFDRMPLAKSSEKYKARTVKMPDSLFARFTAAALAEQEQNIGGFIRACAVIGLEYRERDRLIGAHRGRPGMTASAAGHPRGITAG